MPSPPLSVRQYSDTINTLGAFLPSSGPNTVTNLRTRYERRQYDDYICIKYDVTVYMVPMTAAAPDGAARAGASAGLPRDPAAPERHAPLRAGRAGPQLLFLAAHQDTCSFMDNLGGTAGACTREKTSVLERCMPRTSCSCQRKRGRLSPQPLGSDDILFYYTAGTRRE